MKTTQMQVSKPRALGGLRVLWVLGISLGLAGCSTDVTNPGPVQDDFLNDPGAAEAVVGGMRRAMSDALNFLAFQAAGISRELHPTGGTGSFGLGVPIYNGRLLPDEQSDVWDRAQQARWVAEDGLRRFQAALDPGDFALEPLVAQSYLWAGYGNRLLSENMCEGVIDGSAAGDRGVYAERAIANFDQAITVGNATGETDFVLAAYAGRASVKAFTGDWTGALADAARVPTPFTFEAEYYNTGDIVEANRIHHATKNQPYKTATVWGTVWELHTQEWDDPRTAWTDSGGDGDGAVECCGPVPFFVQDKHPVWEANIRLSSGREMRMLEAESDLRDGDIDGAMTILNSLRALVGVDPLPDPADLTEAWSVLKRERGAELWLEGRRLGDFFRWDRDGTPGALHPREVPGAESHLTTQDLCFPISQSEIDTNPNIGG